MSYDTWREYQAIAREYGDRVAERSQVPLIRHIREGLAILAHIGATERAMRAFCLHPLLQDDVSHARYLPRAADLTDDPYVLALALEYRKVANAALSTRELTSAADIRLSKQPEVNAMLVADKVQNRKDFERHHLGSHPRSDVLDRYFCLWLERLGITEDRYVELAGLVQ